MLTAEQEKVLQARVNAGASLLDRRWPGWFTKVDLKRLNIGACADCVIGQLGGVWVDRLSRVIGDWEAIAAASLGLKTKAERLDHGFTLIAWEDDTNIFWGPRPWEPLTELWVTAIEKRLANAGLLGEAT